MPTCGPFRLSSAIATVAVAFTLALAITSLPRVAAQDSRVDTTAFRPAGETEIYIAHE